MTTTAIRMENCGDGTITNCSFHGFDIGIDVLACNDLSLNKNLFSDVRTGVRIRDSRRLNANNNVQMYGKGFNYYDSQLKPLVLAVKIHNNFLLHGRI